METTIMGIHIVSINRRSKRCHARGGGGGGGGGAVLVGVAADMVAAMSLAKLQGEWLNPKPPKPQCIMDKIALGMGAGLVAKICLQHICTK